MNKEVKRYVCRQGEMHVFNSSNPNVFQYVDAADYDALLAERDGLVAARTAFANEFPPDENGDPDVGSVHANIRALKAERDQLRAEVGALMKWKQTAEYWYGQYRLVKHGESPEQYPTEGKLDDWHNSYHNH